MLLLTTIEMKQEKNGAQRRVWINNFEYCTSGAGDGEWGECVENMVRAKSTHLICSQRAFTCYDLVFLAHRIKNKIKTAPPNAFFSAVVTQRALCGGLDHTTNALQPAHFALCTISRRILSESQYLMRLIFYSAFCFAQICVRRVADIVYGDT